MHCLLEGLIVITTIGSWIRMFRKGGESLLSRRGLESLKYYTTLSNLFAGTVSLMVLAFSVFGSGGQLPGWLGMVKYASAVSLALTFMICILYLGPKAGYAGLFRGELFCLHALGPFLAVLSFVTSPLLPAFSFKDTFAAAVPTLLYGAGYIGNLQRNGIGEGSRTNDWYGFAAGGMRTVPFVFLIILTADWLLALLLAALRG